MEDGLADGQTDRTWFETVWDSARDAMALSDGESCVVAANPAYYELYGYQPSEVLNHPFAIIFPEEAREEATREYQERFQAGVDGTAEDVPVLRSDGTQLWVDVRYSFASEQGDVLMLSLIRDVTDRTRLREAERELSRQREEILIAVAHDLRTPLTSISGYFQMLVRWLNRQEETPDTRVMNAVEQIGHTTRHMVRLLDEMLDASRIGSNHPLHLELSDVDLIELIRSITPMFSTMSESHEIVLTGGEAIHGRWDKVRLERVIENLLANAIKYSPSGGTVKVTAVSRSVDGTECAELSVTDNGMGIPADDQAKIFDRFYRTELARRGITGSGIGLSGVRKIVEDHGGSVEVSSIEGKGSTFTVRLPLHPSAQ